MSAWIAAPALPTHFSALIWEAATAQHDRLSRSVVLTLLLLQCSQSILRLIY